jgi:hypothetical protein
VHDAWEGGERHGVAWRRLAAGVGLAVLVAVSWTALRTADGLTVQTDRNPTAGGTEEPDVVLAPPVRAGAGWVCAAEHPVRAYAAGWFYPPEHPEIPDTATKPEACYLDAEWAEAGGYALAPTPAAVIRAGGLYLVPAVAPSSDACADVAAVVGFVVPCPQRLPAPGRASSCTNSCLFYGEASEPGVVIEQRGFQLPVEWCDDCADHVVLTAVRDRSPPQLIACGPLMASAAAAGDRISGFHDCPPGPEWLPGIAGYPHERHTMLVWGHGPLPYALSMEGHSAQIRTILLSLQEWLAWVEPGGP